jgi:NitT/TauT family transport system permease protein
MTRSPQIEAPKRKSMANFVANASSAPNKPVVGMNHSRHNIDDVDAAYYFPTLSTWQRIRVPVLRLVVFVAFIGLWELLSGPVIDPFWFSSPSRTWNVLAQSLTEQIFWRHVSYTLYAALVGLAVGSIAGVIVGFTLAVNPLLDQVMTFFVLLLNTLPRFALAPLFIVWFGIGPKAKVFFVISLVFFVLTINTHKGIKSIDNDLVNLFLVVGARKRQIYSKLYLPAVTPWIFAGLHLSLGYALATAVVGEMIAAEYGLGVVISRASGLFNISGVFAALLVLLAVAVVLERSFGALENRILRWRQ